MYRILSIVFLTSLVSCDSTPPEPEQTFDEAYGEAKASIGEKLDALISNIEETTKGYTSHIRKAEFVSDDAAGATFDFKVGNTILYFANGSIIPEEQRQRFYSQRAFRELKNILAAPPAEYRSGNKDSVRIKNLAVLVDETNKYSENLEYVILLYGPLTNIPFFRGSDFVRGTYEGTLVVYKLGSPEPIAIKKVKAQSSNSVQYKKGDMSAAIRSVDADFRKNVDAAIRESVESITSVEGLVPPLPQSFPRAQK